MKINLLKDRRVLTEKEYTRERNILRQAIVILAVTLVVTIAITMWYLMLAKRLSDIESSIAKSSKELSGLAQANAEQIYIKNRLQLISGFLTDRKVAREALQQVLSLSIPGVTIGGISTEDDGTIIVGVKADNIEALSSAIAYYKTENNFFTQAVNRGIIRDKYGVYTMNVGLQVPVAKE